MSADKLSEATHYANGCWYRFVTDINRLDKWIDRGWEIALESFGDIENEKDFIDMYKEGIK